MNPIDKTTLFPLLASVLDGESDAWYVLGDLLEEHNRLDAEDVARRARHKPGRLLRFVFTVAPDAALLSLATDYIEHVLDANPDSYAPFEPCRAVLHSVREWAATEVEWQLLKGLACELDEASARTEVEQEERRRPTPTSAQPGVLQACWMLSDALHAFTEADRLKRRRQQLTDRARSHVYELAKAVRGGRAPFTEQIERSIMELIFQEDPTPRYTGLLLIGWSQDPNGAHIHLREELDWQVTHARDWFLQHASD